MIHSLAKLQEIRLRVPDLKMVRTALHAVDERCASCYQIRKPDEMIYLDIDGFPHAACVHCIHDSPYANTIGVERAIRDSESYVQSMLAATDPYQWSYVPRSRNAACEPKDMALEGVAWAIHKAIAKPNVGWKCQGRFGRRMHPNEVDYIDTARLCVSNPSRRTRVFFSRLGATCLLCTRSRTDMSVGQYKTRQDKIEDKLIIRCLCEGLRYAAWLSVVDRYALPHEHSLPGDNGWRLQWRNWLTREPEDTSVVEMWPLTEMLGVKHTRSRLV